MLRCVKVVNAKKLNLQGCARVHEKKEGEKGRKAAKGGTAQNNSFFVKQKRF